ncbi:MAG: NUDIX domain-containing protein [bacterium]
MTKVAVALLWKDGAILLCQRKRGGRYELRWEFPGGKFEPHENTLSCLKRELKEELSIDIPGIERIEVERAFYEDGGMFEVSYCTVNYFSGEVRNNVFEQIQWIAPSMLLQYDILQGNLGIARRLAGEVDRS